MKREMQGVTKKEGGHGGAESSCLKEERLTKKRGSHREDHCCGIKKSKKTEKDWGGWTTRRG